VANQIFAEADVSLNIFRIKFSFGVKVSSITDDKFKVYTWSGDLATPSAVEVTDVFETLDIGDDYDPISRLLTLTFVEDALTANTTYYLEVLGLQNVLGQTIPDPTDYASNPWLARVQFTTGDDVFDEVAEAVPAEEPFVIVDRSIASTVFSGSSGSSGAFKIESTDPDNGEYYLEEDYNNGRVIIKFSLRPSLESLATPNIRVQRKIMQRAPARWETITANISLDSNRPWVYIDLPSIDHWPEAATPSTDTVYYTEGFYYIEPSYKYRILLSKDITS